MSLRLRLIALTALTLAAASAAAQVAQAAPAGCGASSYSYAGVLSRTAESGVGARLAAVRAPSVADGHVAGWVGVGGARMGPNATDEWLQVGISATETMGPTLYYEVALPNQAPRYVVLKSHVRVGKAFDVAVLEAQGHQGSWQVWVNGTAVTDLISLPGSHGTWQAVATAESWNGKRAGTCNRYSFRFGHLRVATRPGGAWQPLANAKLIQAPGYHLQLQRDALLAAGGV